MLPIGVDVVSALTGSGPEEDTIIAVVVTEAFPKPETAGVWMSESLVFVFAICVGALLLTSGVRSNDAPEASGAEKTGANPDGRVKFG